MTAPRKIIHVDMDCFYAAIEMRDDPGLRGRAIAVGGTAERRGVITTASYEARVFGVRSAMATAHALRLCPDLVLLPVRMEVYRAESRRIRAIFAEFTDRIEPLSLDEAYLDVTGLPHHRGSATRMAEAIRRRILEETGLTASAGIAPNKFLAKVASDWNKPDGQYVIRPQDIPAFMPALPVKRIPGVGAATARRLRAMGVTTCGELQQVPVAEMLRRFGSFGQRLHELSFGIDARPVEVTRERKSVSVEETFVEDLPDVAAIEAELQPLYRQLLVRLERARQRQAAPVQTLFVKLKFDDFRSTTLQTTGTRPDPARYREMLAAAWRRGARPVRLVGLGVRFAPQTQGTAEQLGLDYGT
ncbi:MAG: DNA polymerase IV [Chromatiales bacterium]|nr:DNA polymerase IV [Chromatiales bacterium]